MTIKQPVQPCYGTGITVSPGASSSTDDISTGSKQVILTNMGANPAYVRIGKAGLGNATQADYPVPGGAQLVVSRAEDAGKMSHYSPLGTSLHVMNGEGF